MAKEISTREYECPECGNWIELGWHNQTIECPKCRTILSFNTDTEFVDGRWINKSTLSIKNDEC